MKIIAKSKIKDVMITRTAIKCLLPTEVVEKIVDFQGKDASSIGVKNYNEVEFVGFGKFLVSKNKVKNRIKNLERGIPIVEEQLLEDLTDGRRAYLITKLNGMKSQLTYYINKLNNEQ